MAIFKGDILLAGTNPGGGSGSGGHVIQDSTGTDFDQQPNLRFIGAEVVNDDVNEATKVVTPSFREVSGTTPGFPVVCLDGAPIGAIMQYGAPVSTLDTNWLPCLGQAVSRTLYHELFEKIGTIYGSGDGTTTFNVPDYGGKVPVGIDENDTSFDTLGETGGEKTHTLIISEMPNHNHGILLPRWSTQAGANAVYGSNGEGTGSAYDDRGFQGGDQPHNNLQPYIVANYIIKAKQASTSVLQGTINNTYNNEINEVYSSNYVNLLLHDAMNGCLKEYVLYNDTTGSGTNSNVSLSDSSANYDYIEIFYRSNDGMEHTASQKIYSPNGKITCLMYWFLFDGSSGTTNSYIKIKKVNISGTTISVLSYDEININGGSVSSGANNNIWITRVVGYK